MTKTIRYLASCLLCQIIEGEVPSLKLIETDLSYSFLDTTPLSEGHALVVPKYHGAKLHELPDHYLADAMPVAKKIAIAQGATDYNVLQNNGQIANQSIDHVHFHVIPKPSDIVDTDTQGLVIGWEAQAPRKKAMMELYEELKRNLSK